MKQLVSPREHKDKLQSKLLTAENTLTETKEKGSNRDEQPAEHSPESETTLIYFTVMVNGQSVQISISFLPWGVATLPFKALSEYRIQLEKHQVLRLVVFTLCSFIVLIWADNKNIVLKISWNLTDFFIS